MDIQEIRTHLDKFLKDQSIIERACDTSLGKLKDIFTNALSYLESSKDEEEDNYTISELITEAENILSNKEISIPLDEQRRTIARLEKIFQSLSKNGPLNFWGTEDFGEKSRILNETIAEHFIREGCLDIAEIFCEESGVKVSEELCNNFSTLASVIQAIDIGNLEPAIKWVEKYHSAIEEAKSHLDFYLYRAQYIQILMKPNELSGDWKNNILKARAFSKSKLSKFYSTHQKNLQELACAMLYAPDIKSSPYPNLSDSSLYTFVRELFAREFCRMHGYTSNSPLHLIARIGTVAFPAISKMSYVLRSKAVHDLSKSKAIPIELPPLPNQKFHSVFSCPISKEPSSSDNPPIMLACGHVICKNCIACLSKSDLPSKFKCPYCPVESSSCDTLRLYI